MGVSLCMCFLSQGGFKKLWGPGALEHVLPPAVHALPATWGTRSARGSAMAARHWPQTLDSRRLTFHTHTRAPTEGTFVSMGVLSDGSYGAPKDVIFSFPVTTKDGKWSIVQVWRGSKGERWLTLSRRALGGGCPCTAHPHSHAAALQAADLNDSRPAALQAYAPAPCLALRPPPSPLAWITTAGPGHRRALRPAAEDHRGRTGGGEGAGPGVPGGPVKPPLTLRVGLLTNSSCSAGYHV